MSQEFRILGVGEVLRETREGKGVSLRELARRLDCQSGTLSKYEKNNLGVTLDVVEKYAEGLGVAREALVLRCLSKRYEAFSDKKSEVGRRLKDLLVALEVDQDTKRQKRR